MKRSRAYHISFYTSLRYSLFSFLSLSRLSKSISLKMNFSVPSDLTDYLADIDRFITSKIAPLQAAHDNERFFDHRREHSRTDWDNGGLPRDEWEELLAKARNLADEAGFYRFCLPEEFGGRNGSNLWMATIRMHLARKGLGLFNDLQNEHSIVGNFPDVLMVREFGTQGMTSHPK